MKIVWERKDIKPGIRVKSIIREEEWLVGYIEDENAFVLISMQDGTCIKSTEANLVSTFNAGLFVPIELFEQTKDWA